MKRWAEDDRCLGGSITSPGEPPDGKDPLDPANEAMLPAWGLPRKPLGDCARELWRRMLEGASIEPARYVCDPYQQVPPPSPPDTQAFLRIGAPRQASRAQRSRNWSGAWILPREGRRFVAVWGSWMVPRTLEQASNDAEPEPPTAGRGPDAARCSHWIGIGGHLRHSGSLPQVGTMTAVDWHGKVRYYAWYQWWEATRSYGPLRITNLEVNAGDRIVAAVTVEARDRVRLHIRNEDNRQLRSIEWQANAALAPVAVDGKSAEWVVERPSWLDLDEKPHLFRLPRFEAFHFDCCQAETAEAIGAPAVPRDLTGARLVRVVGRGEGTRGSRFLAIPEKRGPGALDVAIRGL